MRRIILPAGIGLAFLAFAALISLSSELANSDRRTDSAHEGIEPLKLHMAIDPARMPSQSAENLF